MKESSYDELTDAVFHEKEGITVGYPFALVLRMRVIQIVCGISTLVMGAVALIDEKSQFNLGFGIPAGLSTVLASANSIYYSKGFDGYQPASEKKKWPKLKFLGTTVKSITFNVVLWGLSTLLIAILTINCVRTVLSGESLSTIVTVAVIEFFLSLIIITAMLTILWIDLHNDPECHDNLDIVHSNTGTGVSMVTLSQSVIT